MFSKKLDRKAKAAEIVRLRAEGDQAVAAANADVEKKRAAFEAWDEPRRAYQQATLDLQNSKTNVDRRISEIELALAADAESHIRAARDYLAAEFQTSRIGSSFLDDKGSAAGHLKAINDAIKAIDALAVSGEADVPAAVNRIMATLPSRWGRGADTRFDAIADFERRAQSAALV